MLFYIVLIFQIYSKYSIFQSLKLSLAIDVGNPFVLFLHVVHSCFRTFYSFVVIPCFRTFYSYPYFLLIFVENFLLLVSVRFLRFFINVDIDKKVQFFDISGKPSSVVLALLFCTGHLGQASSVVYRRYYSFDISGKPSSVHIR